MCIVVINISCCDKYLVAFMSMLSDNDGVKSLMLREIRFNHQWFRSYNSSCDATSNVKYSGKLLCVSFEF